METNTIDIQKNHELSGMTTEEIRQELKSCLVVVQDKIIRMAECVKILESREEPVSDIIPTSLLRWLRLMAAGQLDHGLFIRLQGQPQVLRLAASLPMPDQSAIAKARFIEIVTRDKDGEFTTRVMPPERMLPADAELVFGPEGIRDKERQIAWLHTRETVTPIDTRADKSKVKISKQAGGIFAGGVFISWADMERYLMEAKR